MIGRPGSFLWLVRHDLRIAWRGFAGMLADVRPAVLWPLVVLGIAAIHLTAMPMIALLEPHLHGRGVTIASLAAIMGAVFTWMLAQGIFGLTRTLYHRADLDLLLGSPLPARRVMAAKAVAIAASSFGSVAVLALPIAHMGALLHGAHWLGLYPLLISFALLATAAGLALVVGLFFLTSVRRARLLAHLLGAGTAGAFVLGAQIVAMLPAAWRDAITAYVDQAIQSRTGGIGAILWVPVMTAQGNPVAAALLLSLAGTTFALAVIALGDRFAVASLAAAGAEADGPVRERRRERPFRSGAGANLRLKEWRLLVRDPSFFAQLGLQIVYTIPIAVVLVRSEMLSLALSLGPTIVMIAAQVSGSIAWITVSGEDAPELIASAPVPASSVGWAKLTAVACPVLLLLAVPLGGLAIVATWIDALTVLAFALAAATSTALLNFWHPMPGNRRGMLRRHSQSKLVAMLEHGLAMMWAFAVVLGLMGTSVLLIPLALIAGLLMLSRRLGSRTGRSPSVGAALATPSPSPA